MEENMQKAIKKWFPVLALPTVVAFLISFLIPFVMGIYLSFCKFKTVKNAKWVGFDNYLKECNAGQGIKVPRAIRFYVTYILPVLVFVLIAQGLWSVFAKLFLA